VWPATGGTDRATGDADRAKRAQDNPNQRTNQDEERGRFKTTIQEDTHAEGNQYGQGHKPPQLQQWR